ncbi:MAG: type II toxin-antitoxin system VapC family toxin [Gemmatimonadaceae bacterium]|nr:type II toxin-antitoxin system VapC family toxin [Gemmatimonadaceae bacterium]
MARQRPAPRHLARKSARAAANVVDSSGWLEYVDDGPNAGAFEPAILAVERLIVPTICLLEVFKRMLREKGEDAALEVVSQMRQGLVVDLDADLALEAGRLGLELKLPLADSAIFATARLHAATLWTQDEHFDGMDGVCYIPRPVAHDVDLSDDRP